jgi:hypothetical protein
MFSTSPPFCADPELLITRHTKSPAELEPRTHTNAHEQEAGNNSNPFVITLHNFFSKSSENPKEPL